MGVHRARRYRAAAPLACLALLGCSDGGSRPSPSAAPPETAAPVIATIVDAPPGVVARNGGPVCALRRRATGGWAVHVTMAGRLHVPAGRTEPVFYDVEVDAAGRTFPGWLTGVPAEPIPETTSFWRVPPTPLDVEVPDSEMSPENYLGTREVPPPLEACRLSVVPPDDAALAIGGRQLQLSDDGGPVIIDANGDISAA